MRSGNGARTFAVIAGILGTLAFVYCIYTYTLTPDAETLNDYMTCHEYKFEEDTMIDLSNKECTYDESKLCKSFLALSEAAYANMSRLLRKYNVDDCEYIIKKIK